VRIFARPTLDRVEALRAQGIGPGFGDDMIRLGGLKGFVDGIMGNSSARFYEPYLTSGKLGEWRTMMNPPGNMERLLFIADSAGWWPMVHAIGDHGIDTLLTMFERVFRANGPKPRRWRVIHTQVMRDAAVADRMKYAAWLVFAGIWAVLVYFPVAHWVFNLAGDNGGWIYKYGVIDFAGGTAVHINAGIAGLVLAIVIGKRMGWPKTRMRPHNLTLVMIGAGLLWFGWFGFNAGSALAANGQAVQAFMNTFLAAAAAGLAWALIERFRDGHFTNLGVASGIVAGLVAVTPAAGYSGPMGALVLGLVAGGAHP
jgi:hypothetical protein